MHRTPHFPALFVLFSSIYLIFQLSSLFAQTNNSDARSVGLGGSLVTQSRDVTAMFWNPASLSGLKDRAVLISINDPFEFNFVGFNQFVPLYGAFAASISRIPTDSSQVERGAIAWGRNLSRWFSLGASINFEKLDRGLYASGGLGFFIGNPTIGTIERPWSEAGGMWLFDKLSLGLVVNNIPLGNNLFSTSAMFGASYVLPTPGILLNFGYHFLEGANSEHFGLGFEINRSISILAGIERMDLKRLGLSVGYRRDNLGIQFAYATEVKKIMLTLSMRIGPEPRTAARSYFTKGNELLQQHLYEKANGEFKKYLSYSLTGERADSVRQLIYALDRRVARYRFMVDSLFIVSEKFLAQGEPQFLRAALVLNHILELEPDNKKASRQLRSLTPVINKFVKSSIDDGIREYDANHYLPALKQFKRAIVFDSKNATALYYISSIENILSDIGADYFSSGVKYYQNKKYERARDEFKRALDYDRNSAKVLNYLNRAKEKIRDKQERLKQLLAEGQTLERKKKYVNAANKYLEVLRFDKENLKAKELLRKLRPKINRYVNGKYGEALKFQQDGRFDKATGIYNRILAIDPKHRGARRNLTQIENVRQQRAAFYIDQATALMANQKWQRAAQQFTRALQVDPNSERALKGMREVEKKQEISKLIDQGKKEVLDQNYGQAVHVFENVLELDPGNTIAQAEIIAVKNQMSKLVEVYFNRGIDLYTLDKYQESISELNKVLELEPKHKGAMDYIRQAQERIAALRKRR